jgi:hypothetical protein
MQQSVGFGDKVITTQMQNKCDNKTSCEFTVTDSHFNVSCEGKCSGLVYDEKTQQPPPLIVKWSFMTNISFVYLFLVNLMRK